MDDLRLRTIRLEIATFLLFLLRRDYSRFMTRNESIMHTVEWLRETRHTTQSQTLLRLLPAVFGYICLDSCHFSNYVTTNGPSNTVSPNDMILQAPGFEELRQGSP